REALVWRQLRHENILPFLRVNSSYFEPRHCLISPWMKNGNIIQYLEKNKDHDRLKSIREVASAMDFLHSLDPQVVHGDIPSGLTYSYNNILVYDELRCCLSDFGATIVVATQVPSRGIMTQSSSYWLALELEVYDPNSNDQTFLSARDSYAFGCTIVEVEPFNTY
ncbi:kinase-like domain-containing protein, partial [Armillaria borealis]